LVEFWLMRELFCEAWRIFLEEYGAPCLLLIVPPGISWIQKQFIEAPLKSWFAAFLSLWQEYVWGVFLVGFYLLCKSHLSLRKKDKKKVVECGRKIAELENQLGHIADIKIDKLARELKGPEPEPTKLAQFKTYLDRKINEENIIKVTNRNDPRPVVEWRNKILKNLRMAMGDSESKEFERFNQLDALVLFPSVKDGETFVSGCIANLGRLKNKVTSDQLLPTFDPRDLDE
jgi:hypothetical protein